MSTQSDDNSLIYELLVRENQALKNEISKLSKENFNLKNRMRSQNNMNEAHINQLIDIINQNK